MKSSRFDLYVDLLFVGEQSIHKLSCNHSGLRSCKQDCLELLNNLLRNNASNQVLHIYYFTVLIHFYFPVTAIWIFLLFLKTTEMWYRYYSGRQLGLIRWYQSWSSEEARINSRSRRLILLLLLADLHLSLLSK